ncbi:MAG: metallophosphoesterase family protein [Planctomycetota bacterium]
MNSRTLAIGDIHGCFRSLDALERAVGMSPHDRVITLGDYVDRGPDSKRVLQWLLRRKESGDLVPIRGNHELMLLSAMHSQPHLEQWLASGGDAVLESYDVGHPSELPPEHVLFLERRLRSNFRTETHFFVHANAYADIPIAEQPDYMLYWESFGDPTPHESGKIMVCGHTPQRSGVPKSVGHAICLDTWACGKGWLTCLDVDAGYCWQANERGETRTFWLDQGPEAS